MYWWKVGVGTILCTVTGCITTLDLYKKQHGIQDSLDKTSGVSNVAGDGALGSNHRQQGMGQNEINEETPGGKTNYVKFDVNTLNFNKPEKCDDLPGSWASLFELADNVMDPRQDPVAPPFQKSASHDKHKQHRGKREAKKPKNTKKRRKFSKKKMEQKKDESESESKSKPAKSDSDESDESETAPESDSSEDTSEHSDSSDYSSSFESIDSDDIASDSDDIASDSDDKTESTEEVSLTSEESSDSMSTSEEIHSGPDSSPPASSDSTDESSASKAISGGSSEISYTMSSSASVYSSSEESSEEESKSKSKEDKSKKKKEGKSANGSKSAEKSKEKKSKTGNDPKVTTKIKKKNNKKVTKINIELDKNKKGKKGKAVKVKGKGKEKRVIEGSNKLGTKEKEIKMSEKDKHETKVEKALKIIGKQQLKTKVKNKPETKLQIKADNKQEMNNGNVKNEGLTTERVLQMEKNAYHPLKTEGTLNKITDSKTTHITATSKDKPGMEMLKVKKAEVDSKKKEDLEHELTRDYPASGTVEITNWEGTFAPIAGEPYVAPLHQQPDSFWDGIYRSTDPDLPTPPGAKSLSDETDLFAPTPDPHSVVPTHNPEVQHMSQANKGAAVLHNGKIQNDMLMKTKDKAKKEKKKPKLSPKEKKIKKKEKQKEKEKNLKGPVKIPDVNAHQLENQPAHLLGPSVKSGPHVQHIQRPNVMHAASKSEEILKTPSEEERESGTTYRPEGAYEYPSFRHPDFNPDTAYDENGIPIHESPGWTAPPTLPGDNRFGKGRSRAGLKERESKNFVFNDKTHPLAQHPAKSANLGTHHVEQALHPLGHHEDVQHVQHQIHPDMANHEDVQHVQHQIHPDMANHENMQHGQHQVQHPDVANHEGIHHLEHSLHPMGHKEDTQHAQHQVHPDMANHEQFQHLQHPLHPNMASHNSLPHTNDLQAHLAVQEHGHVLESLNSVHLAHQPIDGKDHHPQATDHLHLADHHKPDEHQGVPSILPAQHQAVGLRDGVVNHKIQKRKADISTSVESKEASDSVMTTRELMAAAEEHKKQDTPKEFGVYKLSDQEKKNAEASAPQEALNPALYVYRNMMQVKKKTHDSPLQGIPEGAELIAVVVSPQDLAALPAMRKAALQNLPKKEKHQAKKPFVYSRDSEAKNPLLYKHRNMFKVSDIKDDGMKLNKELIEQMAMQEIQMKSEMKKTIPIEEYVKGPKMLKGRGLENFNPIFINPNKMFHVRTNNFQPVSEEHFVAKREVNEVKKNPFLYSFNNLFSSNPKQVLPLENINMVKHQENKKSNLDKQRMPSHPQEKTLDPVVKQYMGRGKEAMNPYLINYPNMFKVNYGPPGQHMTFAPAVANEKHRIQLTQTEEFWNDRFRNIDEFWNDHFGNVMPPDGQFGIEDMQRRMLHVPFQYDPKYVARGPRYTEVSARMDFKTNPMKEAPYDVHQLQKRDK